jgi:hypothetical protein
MFNDRAGFRNSSAVIWKPWCSERNKRHSISAISTLLMDSHLYDYQQLSTCQRQEKIKMLIKECKDVGGDAAVLWHPHTLCSDYGWLSGFKEVLIELRRNWPQENA